MTIVNITQAAIISGKDRNTIHRYVRKGLLTKKLNGIDTEDLIRCFGKIDISLLYDKNDSYFLIPRNKREKDFSDQFCLLQKQVLELIDTNKLLMLIINTRFDDINKLLEQLIEKQHMSSKI